MNWLTIGKKVLASKKGRSTTMKVVLGAIISLFTIIFCAAIAVLLLFNSFVCTVSFGLIGDCEGGLFQIVTDGEFEDLGQKMKELRKDINEEVQVPGKGYGEYKSNMNDTYMNEAEVHLRALYQTDDYALQGLSLNDKEIEERFGAIEGNEKRIVIVYEMAKKMKDLDMKNRKKDFLESTIGWFPIVGVVKSSFWLTRSALYDFNHKDWMMALQFETYRCFLIGDEKSKFYDPSSWVFADKPCKDLDELYEDVFGEEKKYIPEEYRGIIAHTQTISEETWACYVTPIMAFNNLFMSNTVYAHHEDQTIPRGDPPACGEDSKPVAGANIETQNISYVDLKEILYAFEEFSVYTPGESVPSDEGYRDNIDYILRELYDEYFGDSSLIDGPSMSPSNGWLIPMQEGTYYLSSPFGWRTLNGQKDYHLGTDFATRKTTKVPIYATRGGVVIFANPSASSPVGEAKGDSNKRISWCGGYIVVKHDDNSSAIYCHMTREDVLVQTGWTIVQGQMIAGVGNDGDSFGEHLDIKTCETFNRIYRCFKNGIDSGTGNDFFDPQGPPANWVLNKDMNKVTRENLNNAVAYFNKVGAELRKTPVAGREKKAQEFLMPGFTPSAGALFGQLPWKYETTFRGPGFCSSGEGDIGGISCGTHQLSKVSQKSFVSWLKAKGTKPYSEYYKELAGIQTGTKTFADKWKALADKNETEFFKIQEEYFSLSYFEPAITNFNKWFGVDLRTQPYAIQEAVYSMYIQHGAYNNVATTVFDKNSYSTASPEDIINKFYNERSKVSNGILVRFSGNSRDVQQGVYNRLRYNEKCDALWLLKNPSGNLKNDKTGCTYTYTRPIGG